MSEGFGVWNSRVEDCAAEVGSGDVENLSAIVRGMYRMCISSASA